MTTLDQIRTQVQSSVWQGIAQSGVNLAAMPAADQQRMVENITNNVLLTFNAVMNQARPSMPASAIPPVAPSDTEETVLWEGAPFLSISEHYTITSERIKIVHGMIGKDIENIELIRVQDIDITQNLSERIFNIGDIQIRGADLSHPTVALQNINDPQEVYEILRKAWLSARKRYGLQFRETM